MRTYDPNQWDISFAGRHLNKGVADGTFLTVASMSPGFSSKSGVDGEPTRSRLNDKRYTARVVLMQTSEANKILSDIYAASRARGAANSTGVGSFFVQDRSGTTVLQSAKAYIADDPDITLEATATTREWLFELTDVDITHGDVPLD